MSTGIFYFSGTGNSLKAARMIGEKLQGGLTPLVNMAGDRRPEGTAGFVVPVYHFDIPRAVKEAINGLDLSGVDYLFAVVTAGGNAGNALCSLNSLCKNKGKALDYGMEIALGDNSIAAATKPGLIEERFNRLESLTDQVAEAVKNRKFNMQEIHENFIWRLHGCLTGFYLDRVCRIGDKMASGEQCSRCGLCVKVCPVNNIQIAENNVEWGNRCADCFACIHWCPRKAISFGKLNLKNKEQYHAPGITVNEIISKGRGA